MRCPTCKKTVASDRHPLRPFCSQRCRLLDLGKWLDGGYAIPGEPASDEDLAGDITNAGDEKDPPRRS
ncbi:MAG: DNA gyrase inhibitor YacG [Candidatus Binatia bacterium]